MKKIAVFLAAALVSAAAFAGATGVGNSYVIVDGNYWDASGSGHTSFVGHDFGAISSLLLGGETTVYTDDWARNWGEDWSDNLMGYCVKDGNDKVIDDTSIRLSAVEFGDYSIKTKNDGVSVDLSSLTAGKEYSIEVWFGGTDNKWDTGNNYIATFSKAAPSDVPEPATMSLLGLGALALALRRKLRK